MFAEGDIVGGNIIPFFNIFDKGYNHGLQAKQCGQICMTPDNANMIEEDGKALLRIAVVAVTRFGNERGVK